MNKKKITKWEPEDFELEMTTHWSFPKRGDWATHDAKWRGNWSPYIPRNIILRYSKENDLVLDQFAGGGTTLVEAKLLNRNIIGVDVNDVALNRCREKVDFEHEGANGKVYLHKGDARNLDFIPDGSKMYIDRATSASKDIEKRVEFLKMIKDSEKGNFNAVIVYKLDRFARSRYDSATYKYRLKRNGVQLISATENITQDPEGIILESVLEGMAEFYSAELSQKINRGMRESAMKHNSIGGAIPLGYKTVDKKLVIDETTAPIVREAFQMYADGESVAEICRTFNNRGYKTSKGTRFGKSSFTKIFRNEKYIGVYKYHDYRAEDVIPPIIDKDLWDRVQVRVGKIKKAPARNKARHTYLLTGKLFCGHCGSAMNADGNSQGYLYYRCYGKKNLDKQCNKRNMEKNLIERLVAQDAMSFLTDEYIEKIATIACDRNKQEIESDSPIPVIRDRIRQVDVSLNNLLKAIETGSAPDMLVKRMGELETEKKDMEVQLKKEMAHQVYIDKEQVIFWLEKFREGDINDEEFCQTVIDLFVNSVTVWDEPDDKFRITIAYNLTSIPQKTYRLSKDGRLSDYASNTPPLSANPMISGSLMIHTFTVTVHPQKRGRKTV